MAKATIDHVARLAGVSIKTVSRVVNREPNVRESTRVRVEAAIQKLQYRPNLAAQNLASSRAHLIGLIYDDPAAYEIPSSSYVLRMQQGSLRACRAAHYELLIHPCNYRKKDLGKEIAELIDHARPAGVILAAPLSNMPRIVHAIEATHTRLIRISPGKPSPGEICLATNDREICAEMTRHLASLGHRHIAFIKGHPSHKAVAHRFLGYKDGLQQSGLRFAERLVISGDNSFGSGEAAARKLLQRKQRPTAIFAANDDMAVGVLRVASELQIAVPRELSVAGFDDISLARQIYPNLTTIRQPLSAMAQRAAELLIDGRDRAANGGNVEIIPATIMLRESTGPVPA